MRHRMAFEYFIFTFLSLMPINMALSQEGINIEKDISDIKKAQQAILIDLMDIKMALSKVISVNMPTLNIKDISFKLNNIQIAGSPSANIILVEFTDYQCPYCSRYTNELFPIIYDKYIKSGVIRYAVVDRPIPTHKLADKAAEATHCAGDQNKYWEMHKMLMSNQDRLDDLQFYSNSLQLNYAQFANCINTNKYKYVVSQNASLADRLGIKAVPLFIIANSINTASDGVKAISYIQGFQSITKYEEEIAKAINALEPKQK